MAEFVNAWSAKPAAANQDLPLLAISEIPAVEQDWKARLAQLPPC